MSTGVPSVLILGHSFVKRRKRDLRSNFDPRADGKFKRWGTVSVLFHGVGGCTVAKLLSPDLHVVARIAPDVLILEIGTNDLVVTSPEIVGSEIENLTRLGALRFSSIISTLCFLSSQRFFVGYIEFFLTRRKIFLCLGASTLTQRFSTIYIVVAGLLFSGITLALKIVYHIPCIC